MTVQAGEHGFDDRPNDRLDCVKRYGLARALAARHDS